MKKLENVLVDVINALFLAYGKAQGIKIFKKLVKFIKL